MKKCKTTLNKDFSEASFENLNLKNISKRLVSCSDDKTIKTWDLNTTECLNTLIGHTEEVWCI